MFKKQFFLILLVFFMGKTIFLNAQEETKKTVLQYQQALKLLDEAVKHVDDEEWFKKNFVFKNKTTNEEKKFAEFDKFSQDMIKLNFIESLVKTLERADIDLKNKIKKLEDGKSTSAKDLPKKDDVNEFLKEINTMRKITATKWEKHMLYIFKTYEDKIPKKERELYDQQRQEYNNKHKLVEKRTR